MKLSALGVPFVCLVLSEPTIEDCIRLIDRHEKDVDAFEVNLPPLDPTRLRDVFQATSRPLIATNRRTDFMRFYGYTHLPAMSETERAEALRRAVGMGADAIDFELDIFAENVGGRVLREAALLGDRSMARRGGRGGRPSSARTRGEEEAGGPDEGDRGPRRRGDHLVPHPDRAG